MAELQLNPGRFYGEVLGEYRQRGLILSELRHERARQLPNHAHELAYFCFLLNGGYSEQFGKKTINYKPMTIMFHPPGTVHSDRIEHGGGRFFSIELQPSWLERIHEYAGRTNTSTDLHGGELVWLASRLYREYKQLDACASLAIEGLVLEMLALVARIDNRPQEKRKPAWLAPMLDMLHAQFQQTLTVDHIAASVGIHPYHLSRVFRQFYHQSIGEYIHRLRVQFCCQQLSDPEAELIDIALAAGFCDQSHFTRVFKRVTGSTPGTFRSALLPGRSKPPFK